MADSDMNTGSLLPIIDWKDHDRIHTGDSSRRDVFKVDRYVSQTLRIRGTTNATGQRRVFMFENKKSQIDYYNPQNTRIAHNYM